MRNDSFLVDVIIINFTE